MAAFWVIFDTSQFPDYYRDVHNLLAHPRSATMRYVYKEKYLSATAIDAAARNAPMPILFVYTQKRGEYLRTEGHSVPPQGVQELLYIATRLGTMLNVTRTAETYYFDFQVEGYPRMDRELLSAVLLPLTTRSEVPWGVESNNSPYGKWIGVSQDLANYRALSAGDDQENWSAIVNQLIVLPTQFAGDSFWRIKGLYRHDGDTPREPEIKYVKERGITRKAEALYNLPENGVWRFEAISEVGRGTGPRPLYHIEVTSTDEKVVKPIGGRQVGLRRSTGEMINFRTETAALIGKTFVRLLLVNRPQDSDWVSGPNLAFDFRVHKNRIRTWLGIFSGVFAALAYVLGDLDCLKQHYPWWAAGIKFAGIIGFVVSVFLLTGKVNFEAK